MEVQRMEFLGRCHFKYKKILGLLDFYNFTEGDGHLMLVTEMALQNFVYNEDTLYCNYILYIYVCVCERLKDLVCVTVHACK